MKKNFLKKLAFTMAFATAFTALSPAAGVFAAAKPSLTVGKTLTLLLGTDRAENDINVKNKVKGSKYAWTTSNKAVATVDKNGVVVGKKTGTAKVTLKITLPTKKTQTLTTTVNVKDNIKEVAINNAPAEAIAIGETYDFNRTIVSTYGGNKKAHKGAITRWIVTDAEGKATDKASADDAGNFVATEPGTYLVQAVSFQSKAKYADFLKGKDTVTAKSEAVKVQVVNTVDKVAQHDLASVQLTFKAPITKEEFEALGAPHVNYVIGNVNIREQRIKNTSIKGNTVKLEMYDPFIQGGTYKVTFGNDTKTVGEFIAAKVDVKEVTRVEFGTDAQVTVNKPETLKVNLLNADGVIINYPASSLTTELNARITYKQLENTNLTNLANGVLTFFKVGDQATVEATFHTYTYNPDTHAEVVLVDTRTFVGVDKLADRAENIVAWTIGTTAGADWDKLPKFIAVGDVNRRLYVELAINNNTKLKNSADSLGKIKLTSSDSSILFVDQTGLLNPIKEGSVTVTVEYNNYYVGSFQVTVNAKRQPTFIGLNASEARLSNKTGLNDTAVLEVELLDQYRMVIEGSKADPVVAAIQPSTTVSGIAVSNLGNGKISFNANTATEGVYTYKITHAGSNALERIFTVIVQKPNSDAVSWRLDIQDKYDVIIENDADVATDELAVAIYGYAENGVKVSKETSTDFTVGVTAPDGKSLDSKFAVTNQSIDLVTTSGTSTSGGVTRDVVLKAQTGDYIVTAYKGNTPVARTTFKVVDSQKKPSFEIKNFETVAVNKVAAVDAAFTIKHLDKVVAASDLKEIAETGTGVNTRIRIDYVVVEELIGSYAVHHKLDIGYFITVSPHYVIY